MKVRAEIGAWSSVVGGGVLLIGEDGRMIGQIAFLCHDDRLRERDMQEKLAKICCGAINTRATPAPLSDPRVKALVEAGNRMANSIKGDYIHPGAATAWDAALAAFEDGGE